LRCLSDRGSPYIWPVVIWVDNNTFVSNPTHLGFPNIVIKEHMKAGQSADIPEWQGLYSHRFDETQSIRRLILVVALWNREESPFDTCLAACTTFLDRLPQEILERLVDLKDANDEQRKEIIEDIKKNVSDAVESAIKNNLSTGQKVAVALGHMTLDMFVESDFTSFNESALKLTSDTPLPVRITLNFMKIIPPSSDNAGREINYQIEGELIVLPVPVDVCQTQVDAVHAAQVHVDDLIALRKHLLANPEGLSEALVFAKLRQIETVDLPAARAALESANLALKECRGIKSIIDSSRHRTKVGHQF
jgi:hypothetical protein